VPNVIGIQNVIRFLIQIFLYRFGRWPVGRLDRMINSRSRLKDSIELSHRHASKYIIYLPIQSSNLHATISALTPVQLDPPYAGNGLSQLLVLVNVPH
jgi:hypothetical protein